MNEQQNTIGRAAHDTGQKVAAASKDMAAEAKAKAQQLTNVAKDRAYDEVQSRKGGVANELRKLGDALENSARQVEGEGESLLAKPLSEVARFCKQASTSLAERGPRQLFSDVEDMGRRQPALFFGVAMAAGFLATRLLRSDSAQASAANDGGRTYSDDAGDAWADGIGEDFDIVERGH